jgi:hypothetical protein
MLRRRETVFARAAGAAALGVALWTSGARGDVTASWGSSSGNWTTAADWSTNPNYPHDGTPSGTNYDVEVGAAGTGSYTVTLTSSVHVDGVSMDSSNAILDIGSGGTLTTSTLSVNSGLLELTSGGVLSAADSSGDVFSVGSTGSLDVVNGTISGGSLSAAPAVKVTTGTFNNTTFDSGTTVNVTGGGTITLNNNWTAGTIDAANATANVGGSFSLVNLNSINLTNSTVNLIGTLNLNTSDVFNPANYGASFAAVGGTISGGTIASGATLNIKTTSSLTLAGAWTNAGTIQGVNAELNLGGSFTPASMGTINLSNSGPSYSQLNITGTMSLGSAQTYTYSSANDVDMYITTGDVVGGTLGVAAGSALVLAGGAVSGSTIAVSTPGTFVITGGTLNGVTFDSGFFSNELTGLETPLYIANGLTGSGQQADFVNNDFSDLYFNSPSQHVTNITLGGEGFVYVGGPNSGSTATVTIDSNAGFTGELSIQPAPGVNATLINNGTISAGPSFGYVDVETNSFTNNGAITASSGGTVSITATNWTNGVNGTMSANDGVLDLGGTWSNLGTITAIDGSSVDLESNFPTSAIGSLTVSANSSVDINGTVDNTNATLTPGNYGGNWFLSGGTLSNGTLNLSTENFNVANGRFSNVTVSGGPLNITEGTLFVSNGINVASQSLNLTGGILHFDGSSQTINNVNLNVENYTISDEEVGSSIILSDSASPTPITLTLGPNAELQGTGVISQYTSGCALVNNGTIVSNNFTVTLSNLTNNGTLVIPQGGGISLGSTNFVNTGTILLNNGSTLSASSAINIGDGTLSGSGTIDAPAVLSNDPSQLMLQIGGTSQGTNYSWLQVEGNITLGGDLDISFANGFQSLITPSERFFVMNLGFGDSMSGGFLNVVNGGRVDTTDGYGSFQVNYGSGEIILSDYESVPEPATLSLMAAAAVVMGRRRRLRSQRVESRK